MTPPSATTKARLVGLFKKKSSPKEAIDEDLSFFTVSEAQKFRTLAREIFAELGYEVQLYPDHATDATGRAFGFWNVAASCHNGPESQWRDVIRQHLQRVLASSEAPDPFGEFTPAEVSNRTYARLYDEKSIPNLDRYPYSQFAPGVVEMLALDLPDTVAVFNHDRARTFGGWEALRTKGLAHLRAVEDEQIHTVPSQGGGSFKALLGDSVYTASKALLLPDLATELTGQQPR